MLIKLFGGVHSISAFPLNLINNRISQNYFISREGKVFSNRGSKGAVQLSGSKAGNNTYFKLGGGTWSPSYKLSDLYRDAQRHARWEIETNTAIQLKQEANLQARALANPAGVKSIEELSVHQAIKDRGSIIGRVHKGHLVFGSNPKIHMSKDSLKAEMLRLATVYPGTKFVQLDIAAAVQAGGVTWE